MFRPKQVVQNLQFGTDRRFRNNELEYGNQPGPGTYNEQNKWNQRTYNLKFLNFQANALKKNNKQHIRSQSLQMGG